ncbi:MAG: transposase [bacterium]|nr:transposase [bacterium]
MRHVTFAPDEWFHCYTRGVDKRPIYMEERDAERYQMLLFSCNGDSPVHLSNIHPQHQGRALMTIVAERRGTPLVDIGTYCLMKNHLHLVLRERSYGGISTFMQKLGTAFTMYFNKKYDRTGTLFASRFKAKHVSSDPYFRRLINYVHANPAELFEPKWKEGIVRDEKRLKHELLEYRFSSLPDYEGIERPERAIIAMNAVHEILDARPSFKTLLEDARIF